MSRQVVVIDGEAAVGELFSKVLARQGFEVHTALTGEAGLELLPSLSSVVCVVIEKHLPTMNGLEVMAEVRRRRPEAGVVLLSSHPEPFQLAERPEVLLTKPFRNLAAIEDAVNEAIVSVRPPSTLSELKDRVVAAVVEIAPGLRKKP